MTLPPPDDTATAATSRAELYAAVVPPLRQQLADRFERHFNSPAVADRLRDRLGLHPTTLLDLTQHLFQVLFPQLVGQSDDVAWGLIGPRGPGRVGAKALAALLADG